jgi:RNA polymerase sigma-70 factor (ECF subfamily)
MTASSRVMSFWSEVTGERAQAAMPSGDHALLLAASAGDGKACRELIARHGTRLLQIVRATNADLGVGEDVVQETFIRALARARDLREEASLFPWLVRIALRVASDYRRKVRRETLTDTVSDGICEKSLSPEAELEERESNERVRKALAALKPYPRELMTLRYFASLSVAELAAVFGKSEVAIRKDLQRARDRVRVELEDEEELV